MLDKKYHHVQVRFPPQWRRSENSPRHRPRGACLGWQIGGPTSGATGAALEDLVTRDDVDLVVIGTGGVVTMSPTDHMGLDLSAFRVDDLDAAKARAEARGLDVVGPTDHGIFKSIYFFDPNGHRLELAVDTGTPEELAELKRVAPLMLEEWSRTKKAPQHAAWLHEKARAAHTAAKARLGE